MTTKIAYISGPISGLENGNFDKFLQAQKQLELEGHIVINPHDLCKEIYNKFSQIAEPTKKETKQLWNDCMKECLKYLMTCNIVFLLDNWETSEGSTIELFNAQKLGIPIHYMRDYSAFDVSFQISKFDRIPL